MVEEKKKKKKKEKKILGFKCNPTRVIQLSFLSLYTYYYKNKLNIFSIFGKIIHNSIVFPQHWIKQVMPSSFFHVWNGQAYS